MTSTAQKTDTSRQPLDLLGGISAREFLREYWQKKPLLIRGAFAGFREPLGQKAVLALAQNEAAESRLITFANGGWQLQHGPLAPRDYRAARGALWTVLVQDTQHFSMEAHQLLARFAFIPQARIDDLMVSYAVPGAGVGPHVDSYDVFLIQGTGSRRWQLSGQRDLRLKPDMPLKLLARFKPEQEFVLESGDMLYLPPDYAHNGIAETECTTWSVGFRAPTQQELANGLLDHLRDELALHGQYRDPDLAPAIHPALIDARMLARVGKLLSPVQHATRQPDILRRFLGRFLTEPKPHVYFEGPARPLAPAAFRTAYARRGVVLDLKTRFLYDGQAFFMNGDDFEVTAADATLLRQLADARRISPAEGIKGRPGKSAPAALYDAYCSGFLHLGSS